MDSESCFLTYLWMGLCSGFPYVQSFHELEGQAEKEHHQCLQLVLGQSMKIPTSPYSST